MGNNIEIPIEGDYDPDRLLARHGKSFHWARYFLGKEVAERATHLYAFCRYLDDIADDTQYDNQGELLDIKTRSFSARLAVQAFPTAPLAPIIIILPMPFERN